MDQRPGAAGKLSATLLPHIVEKKRKECRFGFLIVILLRARGQKYRNHVFFRIDFGPSDATRPIRGGNERHFITLLTSASRET